MTFLLIAVAVGTRYEGIELDVDQQRYRHYHWLLGLRLGSWRPLPVTSRVVIKPHADIVTRRAGAMRRSAGTADRTGLYQHLTLLLSIPGSTIGEVMAEFPLYARERALRVGQQMADALHVPLVVLEGV